MLYFNNVFCVVLLACVVFKTTPSFSGSSEFQHPNSSVLTIEETEPSLSIYKEYTTSEFSSVEVLSGRDHVRYGSKLDFFGKVILVTGSNSGIGKEIALYLAKLGATLSLTGRDFNKLYFQAYKELRQIATVKPHIPCGNLRVDMSADYVMRYTINRFGKLDVLVNCAGILEFGGITNTSDDQFDRVFQNNVKTAYLITKHAVPHLMKTNGTIINVSDLAGSRPFPGMLAYCMSKAALNQFTKCLAVELGPRIRVNSVSPSIVNSNMHLRAGMPNETYVKLLKDSVGKHLLGRIATKRDVARAVAFLASDKASFITGVNFPVDGGRSIMCP